MSEFQLPQRGTPDLQALHSERLNELALHDVRNARVSDEFQHDWKRRTETFDNLYAGRWVMVWPNEFSEEREPLVGNIVRYGADDMAALVNETQPQVRVEPDGDDERSIQRAYLAEQIARGYWDYNEGDEAIGAMLPYDLIGPGAAFVAVTVEPGCHYPVYTRLDPRGCYPTFVRGKLVDLLVVTRMKPREAEAAFGIRLDELFSPQGTAGVREVEILDYYTPTHVYRAVAALQGTGGGQRAIASAPILSWEHGLGRVPVAHATFRGGDGAIRGIFDHVKGILWAQNRLVQLLVDYADQEVYAPWFAYDVINDTEPPGPNTVFRGRSPESKMLRVPPAGSSPQLFAVLEFLERQARSGASYPAQRQGDVNQSIASASFVDRTLGSLTTTVKRVQRKVAKLRRELIEIGFEFDRRFLDERKPLLSAHGDETEYTPSRAIPEYPRVRVLYGAGAGLDALNKRAALHQDLAAGVISLETAREQTEYLLKPGEEGQKRARELVADALLQRMVTDPTVGVDTLMRLAQLLSQGKTFLEAAAAMADIEEAARAEMLAQQGGPPAGGGQIPPQPVPPEAAGLERGALPPEASTVPPPPPGAVLVRLPAR